MLEVALAIPFWLELLASLTGGLSGAMVAVRARYDIFGVVCIAIITGLAGGMLRDVLLQNYGIYAFQQPSLILGCAAAAVGVFFFGKLATYLDPIVDLLDNLSVGLWAIIGVGKGMSAGLDIVPSIIMGTLTAVGGGIIRDICMNRQPLAFQAGTLYGSAAFIGAACYAVMHTNHILDDYAGLICVAVVIVFRYGSLLLGWETKEPRDYSDAVANVVVKPVKSVARHIAPPQGKTQRDRERDKAYHRFSWLLQKPEDAIQIPSASSGNTGPIKNTTEHHGVFIEPKHPKDHADNPSDRIIVDREEFRKTIEQSRAQCEHPKDNKETLQ